jgi:hypothetical protein
LATAAGISFKGLSKAKALTTTSSSIFTESISWENPVEEENREMRKIIFFTSQI